MRENQEKLLAETRLVVEKEVKEKYLAEVKAQKDKVIIWIDSILVIICGLLTCQSHTTLNFRKLYIKSEYFQFCLG